MELEYRVVNYKELYKIIGLWNKNIGTIFPMNDKLFYYNLKMDKNLKNDNVIGAFLQGKLIGFIIFKHTGNINSLIVDFPWRNKGIGTRLLNIAEQKLKQLKIKNINIGRDLFHFFPGIPLEFKNGYKFLANKGYKKTSMSWDLISDISKINFKDIVEIEGIKLNYDKRYVIEELKYCDKNKLVQFFKKAFPGRWYEDTKIFFKSNMGLKYIVVIKDIKKDVVVGFSHIYDFNSNIIGPSIYWSRLLGKNFGGLGPIGIDAEYRKKHLGIALLYKSLEILKKRGVKKMCIDWTDLFDFYGVFNFIPWKAYTHMNKDIQ